MVRADEVLARTTRAMPLNHEDGGLVAELLGSLRHFLRRAILHAERLAVLDARRLLPRFDALGALIAELRGNGNIVPIPVAGMASNGWISVSLMPHLPKPH